MQESKKEKSNRLRLQATRQALVDAGRALFAKNGYAQTGTPEIVSTAKVTRGALYHQFDDKLELFRAVVIQEAEAVARFIAESSATTDSPLEELLQGMNAYFDAMTVKDRAKLLLVDAPSVLGVSILDEIDKSSGQNELKVGLELAVGNNKKQLPMSALATVLSAAFDKAAHAIAQGESREKYQKAIQILLEGIPGVSNR